MKATGPLVHGSCSESSEESINLEELENTGVSPAVAVHHVARHMWLRNCPLADTAALHGNSSCCGSHCGFSAAHFSRINFCQRAMHKEQLSQQKPNRQQRDCR